jgi:polysaccharide biosynthesis protein PslH
MKEQHMEDKNLLAASGVDRILLVTNELHVHPKGGRELLCKLNHEALKGIYGDNLHLFELSKAPSRGLSGLFSALAGHIDGITTDVIARVLDCIAAEGIAEIFLDGSNLGELAQQVRKAFPDMKITVFFHNVEAVFFWDSFRQAKTVRALAICAVNYLAERKSVRASNCRICLSARDSAGLKRFYGRSGTDISPMALKDIHFQQEKEGIRDESYALFVGGTFYANLSGIRWYAKHVAPKARIKTLVVGQGFLDYKHELEQYGGIEVIGGVDDVAPWYEGAKFVVAPIFGGSGMKTKVAEALMFGKRIIGTREAFSGYEPVAKRAGLFCESAEGFLDAIDAMCAHVVPDFDQRLRSIFVNGYSYEAAQSSLRNIMSREHPAPPRKSGL